MPRLLSLPPSLSISAHCSVPVACHAQCAHNNEAQSARQRADETRFVPTVQAARYPAPSLPIPPFALCCNLAALHFVIRVINAIYVACLPVCLQCPMEAEALECHLTNALGT